MKNFFEHKFKSISTKKQNETKNDIKTNNEEVPKNIQILRNLEINYLEMEPINDKFQVIKTIF